MFSALLDAEIVLIAGAVVVATAVMLVKLEAAKVQFRVLLCDATVSATCAGW